MPHELTREEISKLFLAHVRSMVSYWDGKLVGNEGPSRRERLEGVAFSILAAIDGCASGLPLFALIPCPHPADKAFQQAEGEDWYPDLPAVVSSAVDISGSLHELLYAKER